MFYPQEMTEIEMIVPAKDLLAVTKILSCNGVFHQTDSNYLSSDGKAASGNSWQEKVAAYAGLERRVQNILQILQVKEGIPPSADFDTLVDIPETSRTVDQIEQEVKQISDQLTNENKKIEQMQSTVNQLEPIADVEIDISMLRHPHFLYSNLGTMPVENIERLQTSLSRVPNVFLTLRQDNQNAVVWLAGSKNNADILERAARSAYLNSFSLPEDYQGTPAEIIKLLHQNNTESKKKIETLQKEIGRLREKYAKQLHSILWDIRSSRLMTDAITRFGRLQYTYLIVGWVISDNIPTVTQKIKAVSKETIIETYPTKRTGSVQNVPTALKNPRLLDPFQGLVTTYGRPRYGELDPTILMAVMFPLLFGAMFGDVGQGLVLALLGWLMATKRVKALRSLSSLGGVIIACGLSATIFGFLYGSFFGFEEVLHPLWISPVKNILQILMIAIGMGVVLLSLGFILGIINAYKAQDWGRLLFDHFGVAGLIFYWSLIGLVASVLIKPFPIPQSVFSILAIVSGLVVMFSEVFRHLIEGHRPLIEGSLGIYIVQAFFEIFETFISFLSNSLSYVRVGAFAVAHGGLSAAIFLLAELSSPGHGLGYWIVVALGNVFIVGFEGLIVGIQTMRLSYYEFFGKFFTGGGLRYEPLTIRPVVEEQ